MRSEGVLLFLDVWIINISLLLFSLICAAVLRKTGSVTSRYLFVMTVVKLTNQT